VDVFAEFLAIYEPVLQQKDPDFVIGKNGVRLKIFFYPEAALDVLPEPLFPNSPVSSTNRLTASSASGPSASIVTVSPQFRLAVKTSRMLAAENRSTPLTSQIWERKAFAASTNSAAGRAWRPNSLTIVISAESPLI
jgi:hypothetical protein